jgi:hypothetical protein
VAQAVDKKPRFAVQPAASYPGHVVQDQVVIAAKPYDTNELAASAFGKVRPHERGIIPVLVVIDNNSGKPLRLNLKAEWVTATGQHLEAMPPEDVVRFQGVQRRPGMRPPTAPIPAPRSNKKGPLNTPEIEGRAWAVRLLPPGESASGFFYFQAWETAGAKLYLDGMAEAASGQPLFFVEVPLDAR